MTEQNNDLDLINSLGLGAVEGTEATAETAEVAADVEAATAPAKRTEVKIVGTIAKKTGLLPAKVAFGGGGGRSGSKYPFETLNAPTVENGEVVGYDFFEVRLTDVENADAKKLQGAIQAAVAAQNKKAKEDGEATYFVSRSVVEEGAYVGSAVYRTDDRDGDK